MTEDILDGSCCALCTSYFVDPKDPDAIYVHGSPRVCKACWNDLTDEEKKLYQRAVVETE